MDELLNRLKQLRQRLERIGSSINLDKIHQEVKEIEDQTKDPNFWNDHQKAADLTQHMANLKKRAEPINRMLIESSELIQLAETSDNSLEREISTKLQEIEEECTANEEALKFSGPYDNHSAIISIYAGAGGTDAQDWAQMLLRMYTRWAESKKFKTKLINESPGEEAGIKSATITISGDNAYGMLKGEHGVHRLVRLSPFNADNLRQTSFAKVDVLPEIKRETDLKIDEKDLKIDVYRAGGHGGQSVNTTDSAVRVTHLPTGITVAIQNERSQLQNKETAMTILRSRLAQMQQEQQKEKLADLKGPNQSAEWGNQIRSYVLHPYKQVKDLRTKYETTNPQDVLDGKLDGIINAYQKQS